MTFADVHAPRDSAEWRTPAACLGQLPGCAPAAGGQPAAADAGPSAAPEPASQPLRLDADASIVEAARAILARPEANRFDDCLVCDPDRGEVTLRVVDLFAELAHAQAYDALHDSLTGLPNRRLLLGRLGIALDAGEPFAFLLIDIDDFKAINDGLGHDVGDETLRAVAGRLDALAARPATVARLGADEFALLVPGIATRADAEHFAGRVVDALSVGLRTDDARTALSACVGAALAEDGLSETDLLRAADLAVDAAKRRGKGAHTFYEPWMQAQARVRLQLRSELEGALDRGEFQVLYQPIIRLSDGSVAAAEALLRWRRPDGSVVSPADFIPLAEQSGLIIPVGRWVLREACLQAAQWARESASERALRVTVNLSPRQLQYPGLDEDVAAALGESGLPAWKLTLEMTEGAFITDLEIALDRLGACKALGVEIALDDFGSGLSSLGRLSQMPIDVLKLDRSFIAGLNDPRERGIVAATVSLGHSLELVTIGEGVETEAQAAALRHSGCRFGQGFHWARPMEGAEIAAFADAAGAVVAGVES